MTAASQRDTRAPPVAAAKIETSTEPPPPTDTLRIAGDVAGRLLLAARWQQ